MFVGDLVSVRHITDESHRVRDPDERGIVTAVEPRWPDDRYEEMQTVTVQFADGFVDEWYDWQLQVLSSTVE